MNAASDSSLRSLDKLRSYLADARARLLDTTTRNRLVHVNRKGRINALNIINERTESIYRILGENGKRMAFAAQGKDKAKKGEENETQELFETIEDDTPFDESRFEDLYLETPLGPDAQHKRLLKLYAEAKSADEDMGFNILYLAMGFLKWKEEKGGSRKRTDREAPLILLPVNLIRNPKTSTFDIIARDDEIATNLSLKSRLKTDFDIDLPDIEMPDEGFNPLKYISDVRDAISGKPDWDIDVDGMLLCGFRFAKLAMLRDLDPDNWPRNGLLGNPLVSDALGGSFDETNPLISNEERIDDKFSPEELLHILDADASQTIVVEEVRAGRNLVVQGPPGTGKSQTIANMIAALVQDGKRVLFLAEKMAALSVVKDRLDKAGLENLGLEIYSNKANKRQVIDSLGHTLLAGRSTPNLPSSPKELEDKRDTLNALSKVLHSSVLDGVPSPFRIVSRLISFAGKGIPAPLKEEADFVTLSDEDEKKLGEALIDIENATANGAGLSDHPYLGFRTLDFQPTDLSRISTGAHSLADDLSSVENDAIDATKFIGAPATDHTFNSIAGTIAILQLLGTALNPDQKGGSAVRARLLSSPDIEALQSFVETGRDFALAKSKLSNRINPPGLEADWSLLRSPIAQGTGSFFKRLGSAYRGAIAEVKSFLKTPEKIKAPEALALVDEMIALRTARSELDRKSPEHRPTLGDLWRDENTDFEEIIGELSFLKTLPNTGFDRTFGFYENLTPQSLSKLGQHLSEKGEAAKAKLQELLTRVRLDETERFGSDAVDQSLQSLVQSLSRISDNNSDYDGWVRFARARNHLIEKGASRFVTSVKSGEQTAQAALDEIAYARAEAQWKAVCNADPILADIRLTDRTALAKTFRELEVQRRDDVKTLIRATHLSNLPSGSYGGMGTVRSEIGKKRRHLPIRKLMTQAGDAIQRLKPVMLMSPLSVAQYLPPDEISFDVLIIDEASQVRPEDALGALARTKQIVVVGDRKQLPPTSFFSRNNSDDEDAEEDEYADELDGAKATELESILTLCEARGMRAETLEWHYRSRDPSLIKVSNSEFYGSRLVLPPSPLEHDDSAGLSFRRVNGVYHPSGAKTGKPATNPIEADAIVEELRRHARDMPDISAGVVTFSMAQRTMVHERLELARRQDDILDDFLREGGVEDVFVKNIENVQGDERDIIYISVGYGPREPGKKLHSMSFGPINSEGGERRLNVLFSRSRVKCLVFCSFDPADIDTSRTTKRGPKVLKKFLQFAQTGQLPEEAEAQGFFDSPFEEDVATVIEDLGYKVDAQVGTAGFRIDLGVRHPDNESQYMLAVECDGATYHSALWARERDRLRQDVLEYLGWRFHRVWSTDWFYRRSQEISALKLALEQAAEQSAGRTIKGSRELPPLEPEPAVDEGQNSVENDAKTEMIKLVRTAPGIQAPAYAIPRYNVAIGSDLLQTSPIGHRQLLSEIVQAEGPIHQDEIFNRVAQTYGLSKAGSRIRDHLQRALKSWIASGVSNAVKDGNFYLTQEQLHDPPVRSRADVAASLAKVEFISPLEIQAAAKIVIEENGELDSDTLTKAVSDYFGFKRLGPALKAGIKQGLNG